MNIGIIIGRIGGMDGVALETEKWISVLKNIGHRVFILSGQFQERNPALQTETLVPEMSFSSPESFWSQKKAFFYPETDPTELFDHINHYSQIIYNKILNWISEKKIDFLISENASALPSHLEMGLAIRNVVRKTGIPTITHDHDFAWERGERYFSQHHEINEFVEKIFPLTAANSVHAVINSHAQKILKNRFGRDAIYVPNVMDFSKSFAEKDGKNEHLSEQLGFNKNDMLLFQITRIIKRKGIETAIRLIDRLNDERIKLVITGNYADDASSLYYNELVNLIRDLRLGNRINFGYSLFQNTGTSNMAGRERFTNSDAYARATACTYFSTYESFGNEFVEAVLAKRPIFLNNYEPVYQTDIGSKGFKTVMLENNILTDEAVRDMSEIINNPELAREITEHNYELGKKYFSFDTLEAKLNVLIDLALKAAGQK